MCVFLLLRVLIVCPTRFSICDVRKDVCVRVFFIFFWHVLIVLPTYLGKGGRMFLSSLGCCDCASDAFQYI